MMAVGLDTAPSLRQWQRRVFWLLWTAYASYYLARVNFAVAQPAILAEFPSWTAAQVGAIPSTYAAFYAAGQFVNGVIGQRLGARRMMTVALLIAAGANLGFSLTSSYRTMLLLWAVNGFAQSAGWSLVVQTMSNWTVSRQRGTVIGLLSTCYQIGNAASWILAGRLCATTGWRSAFLVPSLILVPVAIVFALLLRTTPQQVGLGPVRDDLVAEERISDGSGDGPLPLRRLLGEVLLNRVLWVLGVGYFCMNAVRYAFMNWSVQYMADFQGRSIQGSAFTSVVIPLVGAVGAVSAGWVSDRWFARRRAPVCALMLLGLAAVCLAFTWVPAGGWIVATAMLGAAGFLVFGPDMLMSGAATVDASHPRAAAAATGMIMSLGATGSIFSGAGVGWLKDVAHGDWGLVFQVLAALALLAALVMATLWNARPKGA